MVGDFIQFQEEKKKGGEAGNCFQTSQCHDFYGGEETLPERLLVFNMGVCVCVGGAPQGWIQWPRKKKKMRRDEETKGQGRLMTV